MPRQQSGERIVRRRRIGLYEMHRCAVHGRIFRRKNQRIGRDVRRIDRRGDKQTGKRDSNGPAARPDIQQTHSRNTGTVGRNPLHELLSLRARDQHPLPDTERQTVKFRPSGHILQRDMRCNPPTRLLQHSFVSHGLCAGVGHGLRPREAAETFGHLERNGTRLSCRIGIGHGTPYSFQHFPAFHFPSKLRKRHLKSNRPSLAGATFRIEPFPVRQMPLAHPLFITTFAETRTAMPRQLTPEEQQIIRQTEKEGAELAEQEHDGKGANSVMRRIAGILVFAAVFLLFACIAYFVVSSTTH